jgi:hypothetical protein
MKPSYFRSLAFAYHEPIGSAEPAGCVLWFKVTANHLRVLAEYAFSQLVEADIWDQVKKTDRELKKGKNGFALAYTVASPLLFIKPDTTYPGVIGQSIAETCGQLGWYLLPADPDEVNGWQRVQNWLRHDADGEPLLTIDPSCTWLIKHLKSGLSKDTAPDTLAAGIPTLTALRFAVMSRPHPVMSSRDQSVPPVGTPAYYMQRERNQASGVRRFGDVR